MDLSKLPIRFNLKSFLNDKLDLEISLRTFHNNLGFCEDFITPE